MLPQTNSQVQVYSRLIKVGEDFILEYAQVETTFINPLDTPILGVIPPPTPSFSLEYYLLIFLLCLVPILVIMAFIYGKRMGQREKVPNKHTKDEALLEKLTISNKSTKETSSPSTDRALDDPVLPEDPLNLPPSCCCNDSKSSSLSEKDEKSSECIHKDFSIEKTNKREISVKSQSCADERSQESWRSSQVNESQIIDLVRNDRLESKDINAVMTYEIDSTKNMNGNYPIPVKELVELHKDESQVKNRKITFGVSTGMENGRLVKKEVVETVTTYEKDAVDPELNAEKLKRAISNTSYTSGNNIPLQIKAQESSNNTESPTSPPVLNTFPSETLTIKSEPVKCDIVVPQKLNHFNSIKSEPPANVVQNIPDNSKILALLENEDLPDETGKFNKMFKDSMLIGEGSFGAVYTATHKLDGKLYAVKKIQLRLRKPEDLHKRSKVLREVFAISNLQHANIVRYFTCWVEIESSKRSSRTNNRSENEPKKSVLAIKPRRSDSPYKKNEKTLSNIEESSMGFEFEAREEDSKIEETVEQDEDTLVEESDPFIMERSISKTLVDDYPAGSSYPNTEMSTVGKLDYLGGYDLYLYIQMEFCAGLSLRNYLDMTERTIERKKVLKMFKKLLEGVNAIHKCGILHRDLKPANVFLDSSENVKIGDFGLASLSSSEEPTGHHQLSTLNLNLERSHSMMVGTPMYSSPEQEKGKKYNQKTDVYSLGLILCEMLMNFTTGHERYLFFNLIKKENKLAEEFKAKYPAESELILKMTDMSPEERPSVEDTINVIDRLLVEEEN